MDIEILKVRARIVSSIRRFFDERDFVEVETAVRIPAPAPEPHIDCPAVTGGGFLRASPELQMKKLLAAGLDRIYQLGPCFRDGERGSRHNPEFTMLEWYRRGADYADIARDLHELLTAVMPADMGSGEFRTLTVREAYRQYAGWDPWADWDQDRFDFDMATKIEPAIKAIGGGVLLRDYPPQAASLARLSENSSASGARQPASGSVYAERWEFYWDGMELANCFTELCDAAEQTRRFEAARAERQVLGEADYPIDREFLTKLPQIGCAAGIALGIDRLVMAITGIKQISAVRAEI